jgi:Na+/proline symporter
MLAALFWRRSTKWGVLAATLWVAIAVAGTWYLHASTAPIAPPAGGHPVPIFSATGDWLLRTSGGVTVRGALPVLPMVAISALLVWLVSLLTRPPGPAALERYFPPRRG